MLTDVLTPGRNEVELHIAVRRGAVPVKPPPHRSATPPRSGGVFHRLEEVVNATGEDVVLDRNQDGTRLLVGVDYQLRRGPVC